MPCSVTSSVLDLFLALAAVPSPPGRERAVADEAAGLPPRARAGGRGGRRRRPHRVRDRQPALLGSRATVEGGVPIFLCAHLDTVEPTGGDRAGGRQRRRHQRPRHDPRRRQQGGGRGDAGGGRRGGAARASARRRRAAADADGGGRPARRQGVRRLAAACARVGYCYDHAAPIGHVVLGRADAEDAPARRSAGRPAHAGIEPEQGRSAIVAAARPSRRCRWPNRRRDHGERGLIAGGVARQHRHRGVHRRGRGAEP